MPLGGYQVKEGVECKAIGTRDSLQPYWQPPPARQATTPWKVATCRPSTDFEVVTIATTKLQTFQKLKIVAISYQTDMT
jgi:hypothetical protein